MRTDRVIWRCPYCKTEDLLRRKYAMAVETDWVPPQGFDPALREFRCPECDGVFYMVVLDSEANLSVVGHSIN